MDGLAYWIGSILCDGFAKPLRRLVGNEADCSHDNTTTGYAVIGPLTVVSIILIVMWWVHSKEESQ